MIGGPEVEAVEASGREREDRLPPPQPPVGHRVRDDRYMGINKPAGGVRENRNDEDVINL